MDLETRMYAKCFWHVIENYRVNDTLRAFVQNAKLRRTARFNPTCRHFYSHPNKVL